MSQETISSGMMHADAVPQPASFAMGITLATLVAQVAASVATAGSLFFSEVLGWVPCTLCWYQRILMYPLSIVLLVAMLRRDRRAYWYVLPLSLSGAGIAAYHYIIQKTDWLPPPACTMGVPCTVDYINLWGFVTIPFLALAAFAIISAAMFIVASLDDEPDAAPRGLGLDRVAAVVVPIAVVVAYSVAATSFS